MDMQWSKVTFFYRVLDTWITKSYLGELLAFIYQHLMLKTLPRFHDQINIQLKSFLVHVASSMVKELDNTAHRLSLLVCDQEQ